MIPIFLYVMLLILGALIAMRLHQNNKTRALFLFLLFFIMVLPLLLLALSFLPCCNGLIVLTIPWFLESSWVARLCGFSVYGGDKSLCPVGWSGWLITIMIWLLTVFVVWGVLGFLKLFGRKKKIF